MMRLAILEADRPRCPLDAEFGRYGQIFMHWISPALPEAEISALAIFDGASLPNPTDYDGYLITGSRHGVYDSLPWMAALSEHIRGCRAAGVPMGGVCFGHQIMAEAYGGKVCKSSAGWVLGRDAYRAPDGESKSAFAIHQDQVETVPDGVAEIHSSERVRYGCLLYDFPAFSVQYHPEFTPVFYRHLLRALRGSVLDADRVDASMDEIADGTDSALLAKDFAEFFRRASRD